METSWARFEWNNVRRKDFGPLFHENAFYTDDTICTIAVADALVNDRHPGAALMDWGRRYFDNGGWGGMFSRWLARGEVEPYNSYGNGAAMRVSPQGCLPTPSMRHWNWPRQSLRSRTIIQKASKVARRLRLPSSSLASVSPRRTSKSPSLERFGYNLERTPDDIRPTYRFNETCEETVPQALVCALTASDFEDAIRNAISIGGDSDTVAAITGGVAEALFGVPEDLAAIGWSYLPQDMRLTLTVLYQKAGILL